MSRSKEQCLNIISQHFIETNDTLSIKNRVLALEKSIKEISDSEYSLIWTYNYRTNRLKTAHLEIPLSDSILKTVCVSKKVFFENHIQSHKKYDKDLDNPLKINIKSILIAPVLDEINENVIGFITAFNSRENGSEFQRYDTRSITLLDKYAREVIELLLENNFDIKEEKEKDKKKIEVEKKIVKLSEQERKIIDLEKLLTLKDEEIKKMKEKKNELILIEDYREEDSSVTNAYELEHILSFLTNEVTYLSNDSHSIYTFLEVIKNSLYDKEQLGFIDEKLRNSQLLNNFSDSLYNQNKMPIINKEFQLFQSFSSILNLYSKAFSEENITFNIFIDPRLPTTMVADIEKIKSIIVHLINNAKGLIGTNGIAEVMISSGGKEDTLELIVRVIKREKEKKISNFFKSKVTSNSLTFNSFGLGLSVSSNLINILGAKLKLTTERKNEHSFTVVIPVETINTLESQKKIKNKKPLKIGILVNEENKYAYINLRRYLDAFSIDSSSIATFNSYKKMRNLKISHFLCFENMLIDKIELNRFPSITVLKYSDDLLSNNYRDNVKINKLYVNSYYGMALQKILFPNISTEELLGDSLLEKGTFFTKIMNKLKIVTHREIIE